ncbi:putative hydrolase of the HAD superfamily [Salinibacillus kushneri]|uniref:Putative hydrolase of the HAD superfamily n=1 Tax=Salinibacillus kushneri TaxID=237682 RepID=A0A1I0IHS8_9BACI|nr:HAD family hydrolase [Salinibacillus kushneri]SET96564.1 putative hydrolase of the HAD superfamily [Salinibacillus kushneri]
MIKAVIFDLDGTLLNRDASLQKFLENQYNRLHDYLGHISKGNYVSRFIKLDCHGFVWKDKVYQQMVNEFNIREISWERLLQDYITEFHNSCIPFTNLISTLERFINNSIRLGMITNGKGQFQMDNIRALGIESYFDTILISEWEGMKKPNPEIFQKALTQMNVSPNESMYVGDHPENDVKGAKNTGMWGVWKKDTQSNNVNADFIIEELNEIPFLIQDINKRRN